MKLEEIFTFEHLYDAHKDCRKSKQHKTEVIYFEIDLSMNISKLVKEINSGKYHISKYKKFYIYEPKERLIEAPIYKDRVVIRCFCKYLLEPKINSHLIYDNAACRKQKGTSFAINRLEYFLRKEYRKEKNNDFYFLKCDIRKYFPSIDHKILMSLLEGIKFSNEEMNFIKKLVDEQEKGLPLGNQSSQWFALFYLNGIDHFIKEKLRIKYYIRYMDDMILIHSDKNYLQYCLKEIKRKCQEELKLELNDKTQIGKVSNGIDFLGYHHKVTKTGKIIRRLRSSSKIRLQRHLNLLIKLYRNNTVDQDYVLLRQNAYYNQIIHTKGYHLLKKKIIHLPL